MPMSPSLTLSFEKKYENKTLTIRHQNHKNWLPWRCPCPPASRYPPRRGRRSGSGGFIIIIIIIICLIFFARTCEENRIKEQSRKEKTPRWRRSGSGVFFCTCLGREDTKQGKREQVRKGKERKQMENTCLDDAVDHPSTVHHVLQMKIEEERKWNK